MAGARRYGVVPSRADCFQHRAVARELAGVGGTTVLAGLGGVGKTQLAADYAESVAGEVELLVWITADSRQAVLGEYAAIIADLTGFQSAEPEAPAKRFLAYLAGLAEPWLVVLDDVRSPADLRGLWPPVTGAGRVVVTTRRRDAALLGQQRTMVDVGTFGAAESLAFLRHRLAGRPEALAGAAELTGELGQLPLALGQAAAYLLDRQISCAEYRQRLRAAENSLESLAPERESLPEDQREPVARTWRLSVRLADELSPVGLAKPLLDIASVLDPHGIPGAVFTSEAVLAHLGRVVDREVTAIAARDALGCLHRLSLVEHDARQANRAVRVHALVQRATRESLFEAQVRAVARCAADALVAVWPGAERAVELGNVLRANSFALRERAAGWLWESGGHELLFRTGRSLGESGQVGAAVAWLRWVRAEAAERLGAEHPDTLRARQSFARWLGNSGDITGAIVELDGLLADRVWLLGRDHPDTLTTRHSLARWRGKAGDHRIAAEEAGAVLDARVRVLGPDHVDTLSTRHSLAQWQAAAGDVTGAIDELRVLIGDMVRVLGAAHPTTLGARHDLAYWRAEAGEYEAAISELAELLPEELGVRGPEHRYTLITRRTLASCRVRAGDQAAGRAELHEVLADMERVLGPEHPDTVGTRRLLTDR